MNNCAICAKQLKGNRAVVCSNDQWLLIAIGTDATRGYLHLETKRHMEHWQDLNVEEQQAFFSIIKVVEQALKEVVGSERLYMTSMNERDRHLHFHLIPRLYSSDQRGLSFISEVIEGDVTLSPNKEDWVARVKTYFMHA